MLGYGLVVDCVTCGESCEYSLIQEVLTPLTMTASNQDLTGDYSYSTAYGIHSGKVEQHHHI